MFEDLQSTLSKDSSAATATPPDRSASAPLVETMFGLENGVASFYPGSDVFPDNLDARLRPWYRLAAGQKGAHWGRPYRTHVNGVAGLPCSISLYQEDGKFLGVASVLLAFDYLVEALIRMPENPKVHETFLLDDEGRIVVRWSDHVIAEQVGLNDVEALPLIPFSNSRVRDALRSGRSGTLEGSAQGRPVIFAFDSVDPFGWGFVAVADRTELLK
jgi:hypothetical protein